MQYGNAPLLAGLPQDHAAPAVILAAQPGLIFPAD
jgi:hypothetical protein